MPTIEARKLSWHAGGKDILHDVSLTAEEGKLFVLCGPSGAGKTTLLRLMTGELEPSQGDILLDGRSILAQPMQKRGIVLVDQANRLFPHMTVRENAEFPMKLRHMPRQQRQKRLAELADQFHLQEQMALYPAQLSGGQQKLAAIMRALAAQPQMLLLDEPFAGMDNLLHLQMRSFLAALQKERSLTVMLITHSKEDAFILGDRIGFLFGGELRLCADRDIVLSKRHDDPAVSRFLGDICTLPDGSCVFADKLMRR